MKSRPPSTDLAEAGAFPPPLSDIEVARMWRALSNTPLPMPRRRPSSRPPLLLALALAIVVATTAFGLIVWLTPKASMQQETEAAVASAEFGLPDGSRLTLGTGARLDTLRMDQKVIELALSSGALDVAANDAPERQRFSIAAGGYDIVAGRGHFRVSLVGEGQDKRLEVIVHSGTVDVHDPAAGATTPLVAGRARSAPLPEP